MSASTPSDSEPEDLRSGLPPAPTDPEFIRMMQRYEVDAEQSRKAKAAAIERLSRLATDDEILRDIGLDMAVLRQDP